MSEADELAPVELGEQDKPLHWGRYVSAVTVVIAGGAAVTVTAATLGLAACLGSLGLLTLSLGGRLRGIS